MGAHPRDGAPDGIVPGRTHRHPRPERIAQTCLARVPRIPGGRRTALVIASDPGQLYAIAQPRITELMSLSETAGHSAPSSTNPSLAQQRYVAQLIPIC